MCQTNCDNYKNTGELTGDSGGGESNSIVQTGTINELQLKTGMVAGELFFAFGNTNSKNKLWVYTGNTWQVSGETIEMIAGETLFNGELIEMSTTGDYEVVKTTSAGDVGFIGVVQFASVDAGDYCTVAVDGVWPVRVVAGTYTRANYLRPSSTAGLAEQTTSVSSEPFAKICLNAVAQQGAVVDAVLHSQEIY